MNLEFYMKAKYGGKWELVSWERMFEEASKMGIAKHVVLVESNEELEFIQGLQYIMGAELNIQRVHAVDTDTELVAVAYPLTFVTWNPRDRNRI